MPFWVQSTDHHHNDLVTYLSSMNPWIIWSGKSSAHDFATRGGARNFVLKQKRDDRYWPARKITYRIVPTDE